MVRNAEPGESREPDAAAKLGPLTRMIYPAAGPVLPTTPPAGSDGFAPADLMDHRARGQWESRYPPAVHRLVAGEALYLGGAGLVYLVAGAICLLSLRGLIDGYRWSQGLKALAPSLVAFVGGALGGTLFGLKWLYHSVAKGMWSEDRRLWRLFTPWISATLALAFIALVRSGVVQLLNSAIVQRPTAVFGVSFLVGYFSDTTIGKLNEVVQVLFGRRDAGDTGTGRAGSKGPVAGGAAGAPTGASSEAATGGKAGAPADRADASEPLSPREAVGTVGSGATRPLEVLPEEAGRTVVPSRTDEGSTQHRL